MFFSESIEIIMYFVLYSINTMYFIVELLWWALGRAKKYPFLDLCKEGDY